jgi:hypothetical protein
MRGVDKVTVLRFKRLKRNKDKHRVSTPHLNTTSLGGARGVKRSLGGAKRSLGDATSQLQNSSTN